MAAVLRRVRWRRAALLTLALAVLLCAVLWPDANTAHAEYRGNSIWLSSGPDSPNGGLMDRYPLSRYQLDVHIDGGLDNIAGNLAQVVGMLTSLLWMVTAWALWLAISLFGWAFNLNLLTGEHGALGPVAQAVGTLHTTVLGNSWVVAGLIAAGGWGVWKGLGQRRFAETVTALGFGVALMVAATFLVVQPQQTVGWATGWTDEISSSFLSANGGRTHVSDQLVETLILAPWTALEFGGSEHCVRPGWEAGGDAVRPVKPSFPGAKTCRKSSGYARAFLAQEPGSDPRDAVYSAIEDGTAPYDHADEPAVDTMQQGGAYERFAVAVFVFGASLGAVIVLGALALGIVLAQIVALFLLAFAPLALVAAPFPPAHRFVTAWFRKLGSALFIKVLYSLALAGVIAVSAALAAATAALGFVLAFGLQAALYWTLFAKRNWIAAHVGLQDTGAAGRMARHPVAAVTGARDRHVKKQEASERRELTRAKTQREDAQTELVRDLLDRDDHRHSDPPTTAPEAPMHTPEVHETPVSHGRASGETLAPALTHLRDGFKNNGGQPADPSQETDMTGNRVPPRVDKTHIHANGEQQQPEPVVFDADRDTSHLPKVPVRVGGADWTPDDYWDAFRGHPATAPEPTTPTAPDRAHPMPMPPLAAADRTHASDTPLRRNGHMPLDDDLETDWTRPARGPGGSSGL